MRNEQFRAFANLRISVVHEFAAQIGVRPQKSGDSDFDYRCLVWRAVDTPAKIDAAAELLSREAALRPLANELRCHLDAIFADATPNTSKHVDLAVWVVRNKKKLLAALANSVIDQAQMERDFEALNDAPEGTPEYKIAFSAIRRAREIVWAHEQKHGDIAHSVELQDAIADVLSFIQLTSVPHWKAMQELTAAMDKLLGELPPNFPNRAYFDEITAMYGRRAAA